MYLGKKIELEKYIIFFHDASTDRISPRSFLAGGDDGSTGFTFYSDGSPRAAATSTIATGTRTSDAAERMVPGVAERLRAALADELMQNRVVVPVASTSVDGELR